VADSKIRTLILCVDKDDDIGKKANIVTPIIGKDDNMKAATTLAIADPEEADSNAMFGAIKLYIDLMNKYPDEVYQVATITGEASGGFEADRKLVKELSEVNSTFQATNIILVTDGFSDEDITPIIESRIPITSIRHIVVKHSERIEETYAVFFKYLQMLVNDPYYSRLALGVPGLLLLIYGFLMALNQLQVAGIAVTLVLGFVFILKGFGFYDKLTEIRPRLPPPERQLIYVSRMIGAIVFLVGCYQGINSIRSAFPVLPNPFTDFSFYIGNFPVILAHFVLSGVNLIIFGIMVALAGGAVNSYLHKDEELWQSIISLIVAFWLRLIAIEAALIFLQPTVPLSLFSPLVLYTIASVISMVLAVALIYRRYKKLPFS
jgi:putative membrane protein